MAVGQIGLVGAGDYGAAPTAQAPLLERGKG
ncbi:hypothetical protein FF80_02912 [Devosia sp. LC5]|nr:hypothetical protein FF80_02912 [Devosia sp. LC5]